MSPKQSKANQKKINSKRSDNVCKLAASRKKNYSTKRVGSVADGWNAKVVIEDEGNRKRKGSVVENFRNVITKKRKELEKENDDGYRPSDVWIIISGVKLTYELRGALLSKFG